MYPDPLSIAVAVVGAFIEETGIDATWQSISIHRLISGYGWLVSATQSSIVLDHWMEKAA